MATVLLTFSVRGPTLDVRFLRLKKIDPRAERVKYL